jgi:hypothetical protein
MRKCTIICGYNEMYPVLSKWRCIESIYYAYNKFGDEIYKIAEKHGVVTFLKATREGIRNALIEIEKLLSEKLGYEVDIAFFSGYKRLGIQEVWCRDE